VDPVCHTLVGAAMAEAGLKRQAPHAMLTLVIAANLPDVDVLSYACGALTALGFRRGWTHGLPALIVLPVLLAAAVVGLSRLYQRRSRSAATVPFGRVAVLAYLAVLTHPLLDTLNTYGMRWLMPFSGQWLYGDTLFIVDPWMWAVLAGGVFLARRRGAVAPARTALVLAALYILAMGAGTRLVRREVRAATATVGITPVSILVSPVPVNPLDRLIVVDDGERYHFGRYRWGGARRFAFEDYVIARNHRDPAAVAASTTPQGAAFLRWARYPFFLIEGPPERTVVHIVDARYTLDPDASFGAFSVRLGGAEDTGGR